MEKKDTIKERAISFVSVKVLDLLIMYSTAMLNRFGDIINQGTREAIQSFEKRNQVSLCKDGIMCGYVTPDDCNALFSGKVNS